MGAVRSPRTHIQPRQPGAEMSDAHEPRCHNQLQRRSPSRQRRPRQETVSPVSHPSPALTLPRLPAHHLVTCPDVLGFHKINLFFFCAASEKKLLKKRTKGAGVVRACLSC